VSYFQAVLAIPRRTIALESQSMQQKMQKVL